MALGYEPRFTQGYRFRDFLIARLVRLWPVVLIGTFSAVLLQLAMPQPFGRYGPGTIPVVILANAVLLPLGAGFVGGQALFPLKNPSWSLSAELLVNIGYGAIATHARSWLIAAATSVAAAYFLWVGLRGYSFHVGWGQGQWAVGVCRTITGFGIGVLLARWMNRLPRMPLRGAAALALPIGLAVVLALPTIPHLDRVLSAACLFIGFPLIIVVAARSQVAERLQALSKWAGHISYPLYLLHYPVIALAAAWTRGSSSVVSALAGIGGVAIAVALAQLTLTVDEPARRYLRRILRTGPSLPAETAP